jgi:hypothetical protein
MSNRGQAQYLRLFDDAATYTRWQGYYVNQTITWQNASWNYHPFTANGLIGGTAGTDVGVTIDVPATSTAVAAFENALNLNRLCEVRIYEFDTRLTQAAPQATQALIGIFVGEVISLGGSFASLTVSLGSSLAPVGAQVPPRKYTNILIGAPLRL